jgi:hypothetical protein
LPVSNELSNLHPIDVQAALSRGRDLVIFKSKQGKLTYDFVNSRTLKVDGGRLSTFLLPDRADRIVPRGYISIKDPADGQSFTGKKPEGIKITVSGQAGIKVWRDDNGEITQEEEPTLEVEGAGISDSPVGNRPQPYYYFVEWSTTSPFITESGTYPIVAYAKYAGEVAEHKITITVSIEDNLPEDKTPPDINITHPETNAIIVTTAAETVINIKGTSSDSESGVASVLVNISDGYSSAIPIAANDWSQWSFQGTTSKTGLIQLTAKATDKKGNEKMESIFITIQYNVPVPKKLRLFLVEAYRLSSYLGQYGAGRVVKTFSLLPGEKTTLSVKTYTKTRTEAKQSSSILDSITDESTKDFENTLSLEQSDKENYQESSSYEVNARAEASWGWGKAEVSGGIKGGTNSARETFGKNLMNTTQKHASKASSKRDVTINTSYETSTEQGEETSLSREIQNINVGRTLNFVFRQMNQEILTILHLLDARIAVWDGDPNPDTSIRKEYSISELDNLYNDFIKDDPVIRSEVRTAIRDQLDYIVDYKGDKPITDFIEEVPLPNGKSFLKVRSRTTPFKLKETGTRLMVPGIIISTDYNVMRTDGILVEALLGQANALDDYSTRLQTASITSKELENEQNSLERARKELAVNIINDKDSQKADLFEKLYPCCKPAIFSLWPPKEDEPVDG